MGDFWNPIEPPEYPDILNKWVEQNVIAAVEQAIEEDGTFLIDHTKPGIEITFISWDMPEDKKIFLENGKVEKDSYWLETTLESLLTQELDMLMKRQHSKEQRDELREYVESVEALAAKIREKSGI